jgi:hypothetical protein
VHEGAPGGAVAIDERMDRLELRVSDGRLWDGRHRVVVDERAQVLEQFGDEVRGRRDERGRARIEAAPANPVLAGADLPGVLTEAGPRQEPLVHLRQTVDGDRLGVAERVDRPRHRVDVSEHLVGGDVDGGVSRSGCGLGTEQPASAHEQPLDERRGHGLGAEEQSSHGLGVGERRGRRVEGGDRLLGVGNVGGDSAVEPEGSAQKRVGHVRLVLAGPGVPGRRTRVVVNAW